MNHLSLCQRKLNEDIVDYDLLKDLVCYIDETYPEGTILVFLTVVDFRNCHARLKIGYLKQMQGNVWTCKARNLLLSLHLLPK
ncbi:hypothetical protein R3W88_003290 [Solanum pinnatisectum]|uniref:Uncharacterized protein n=1 Tax=Solanum pinnatisectum TaxID=50273 RepID=A0AAV9MP58_9SOLN|nr:hypothetical protein R3W88_003290 [Solanum pinnatisectum]